MNVALIEVRGGTLIIIGLLNTGHFADRETKLFINVNGITGMDNLPMLNTDQLSQNFNTYNNGMPDPMYPLLISNQHVLAGLLWGTMYSKRRGRALDPTTFTADVTRESLTSVEGYLRNKDNTSYLTIPMYQENCDFEEWYLRFQNLLVIQTGIRDTSLGYIIR